MKAIWTEGEWITVRQYPLPLPPPLPPLYPVPSPPGMPGIIYDPSMTFVSGCELLTTTATGRSIKKPRAAYYVLTLKSPSSPAQPIMGESVRDTVHKSRWRIYENKLSESGASKSLILAT